MLDAPTIVQTIPQPAAVIRFTIPRAEIQRVMGPAFQELFGALAAQGIAPAGPAFSHHFRMDPEVFDFVVGVPVPSPVTPTGRVKRGELPGAKVARAVYRGGYERLGEAWSEFMAWIGERGLETTPDFWECYTTGPGSGVDPSQWATELNRPLVG